MATNLTNGTHTTGANGYAKDDREETFRLKAGLAQMLKVSVLMMLIRNVSNVSIRLSGRFFACVEAGFSDSPWCSLFGKMVSNIG